MPPTDYPSNRSMVRASDIGTAIDRAPVRPFQVLLVLTVLLILVIDGLDIQLLSLVAPLIVEEWGVERSQFGIALSAALVGMSAGTIAGGLLGDRFGRRNVLLGATILFGGATFAAGFTDSVAEMTALRLLSGLGFGAAAPNGIALATDWLPSTLRAQATSLLSIGTPAGGMIGAILVLGILPAVGWRGAFFACGILTILLAGAIVAFVKESAQYTLARGRVEPAQRALQRHLDVAIRPRGLPTAETIACDGTALAEKIWQRALLRLNIGGGIGFLALSLVSYAFIAWTPLMLSAVGFTVEQGVTAIFAFNLAAMGAALVAGFLVARFGTRTVIATAIPLLILTLAAIGVSLASYQPGAGTEALVSTLIGGAGGFAGMGMASFYTLMAAAYPARCRAGGIGFGLMAGRIGGIVATFAGGYVVDAGTGGQWPFVSVLLMSSVLALGCALLVDRHVPSRRQDGHRAIGSGGEIEA